MVSVDSATVGSLAGVVTTRDDEALALWTEHYGRIVGWCAALTGDVDMAHDVASEAFVRLLSRLRSVRRPVAFLYVVALNDVRDRWRRSARDARLVDRLGSTRPREPTTDGWLGELVAELPDKLRDVVLLHYYADLTIDDVAAQLHRPVGTVKRQLAEGRARLRAAAEENRDR